MARMLIWSAIGACALTYARAQEFQGGRPESAAAVAAADEAPVADEGGDYDYTGPDYEAFLDTNGPDCPPDLEISATVNAAVKVDLWVEDPDMCTVFWQTRVSKSGGIYDEAPFPSECTDKGPFTDTITWANGVANGGVYYILVDYYSDGGCPDAGPVEVTVTIKAGGKLVQEIKQTLDSVASFSPQFVAYVLGFRTTPEHCDSREPSRRGLLSDRKKMPVRKDYCTCFNAKIVDTRGTCVSVDEIVGDQPPTEPSVPATPPSLPGPVEDAGDSDGDDGGDADAPFVEVDMV